MYCMRHAVGMAVGDTSIRVSRATLEDFSRLQRAMGAKTADEALQSLMRKTRRQLIAAVFGIDRGRIRPFTEADRIDSDR